MEIPSETNRRSTIAWRLARLVRIRFSLRSLLVFVAFAAILLALANYSLARARQHAAARTLLQIGAYVGYDDGSPAKDEDLSWDAFWFNVHHDVTKVVFRGSIPGGPFWVEADPSSDHLRLVATFDRLATLHLDGCEVTDVDLTMYAHLPLEELNLSHTLITDNGLRDLAKIATLRVLYLQSGERYSAMRLSIGDPIPEHRLQGPTITDAGVRFLADLPALETLSLEGSSISNESIEHLNQINTLRLLFIDRTNILQNGVAALKQANPQLEVVRAL